MSRKMLIAFAIAACITARPLAAQSAASSTGDVRMLWEQMTAYVLEAANDMPEGKYTFKPTPEVRTFGQLIGHVAGSQQMFCAIALGEAPPAEDAVEKAATTKAALVKALQASNEYCRRAYTQTDAQATGMVNLFGQQRSRLFTLMMNASHDGEHYGNIVTYMRMNGMVPPSSKPRPATED